ncbi:MAG: hypothetical protein ACKO34_01660 [Vampirovibrionales bacterium]
MNMKFLSVALLSLAMASSVVLSGCFGGEQYAAPAGKAAPVAAEAPAAGEAPVAAEAPAAPHGEGDHEYHG